jgi:hypothetical protein
MCECVVIIGPECKSEASPFPCPSPPSLQLPPKDPPPTHTALYTHTHAPVSTAAKNREERPDWCCNTPCMYTSLSPSFCLLEGKTASSAPPTRCSIAASSLFARCCCFPLLLLLPPMLPSAFSTLSRSPDERSR